MTDELAEDTAEGRTEGDAPADAVVAELGERRWMVNAALAHVHRNGEPLPASLPRVVARFFEDHASIPTWLDRGRIDRAARWASAHLLEITTSLFCASLPYSFAAARGARVLAATGRMGQSHIDRRLNETARFVLDVIGVGGFDDAGGAVRAIQKVRLVHACVRADLLADGSWGETPINQEDLLGTLCTFSVVVVESLRRLGVEVSDDEAEDYFHLWRGVGATLGIEGRYLPATYAQAARMGALIGARELRPSDHGRALMSVLLDGMRRHVPRPLAAAPGALVRHLLGDRVADMLDVPAARALADAAQVFRLLPRWRPIQPSALARRAATAIGRPLLDVIVLAKLGGRPPTFAMPGGAGEGAGSIDVGARVSQAAPLTSLVAARRSDSQPHR